MSSDDALSASPAQGDDEFSSQADSYLESHRPSRRSARQRQTTSQLSPQSQYAQLDAHLDPDIFGDEPIIFNDRHSDSSVYEPSDHSPSPAPEEAQLHETNASRSGSDSESTDPTATSRKRPTSSRPSLASSDLNLSPTKRIKPTPPLNHAYLSLLNEDIEDARARYTPNTYYPLEPSQIGLTIWTALEKELFFEALARLGRDDAPGIAARMGGSKGELEVQQYLMLLRDAVEKRKAAEDLEPLVMADMPAAMELSVRCCFALDEAAEAVASRVEGWEAGREDERWNGKGVVEMDDLKGSGHYGEKSEAEDDGDVKLTAEPSDGGYSDASVQGHQQPLEPAELFHVPTLLTLSSRLFMNAPFADGHWRSHSATSPAIRTTALSDLHGLTLSILRRLMSATLFIAQSRVRSKTAVFPWTRKAVRRRDVHAAARSIGLETDARKIWVGMARRLRLRVFANPPRRRQDEGVEEEDELRYGDVETELSSKIRNFTPSLRDRQIGVLNDQEEEETAPVLEDDAESLDSDPVSSVDNDVSGDNQDSSDNESSAPKRKRKHDPVLWAAARAEAAEIIAHSAVGFPTTRDPHRVLTRHIISEMKQESYAEELDRAASIAEEKRMWELLGQQPPEELRDDDKKKGKGRGKEKEATVGKAPRKKKAVEDVVWPGGVGGRDWRERCEWKTEWEAERG